MSQTIDPKHQCPSVSRPEVKIKDGAIHLSAVGLPVILQALYQPGSIWFSCLTGEYEDEIRIVLSANGEVSGLPLVSGVVKRFIGETYPVKEYELTEPVAESLGIDLNDFQPTAGDHLHLIASHDEHWSLVRPFDDNLLYKIVAGVLQQICFLLNSPTNWEPSVIDKIVRLAIENDGIHIQLAAIRKDEKNWLNINQEVLPESRNLKEKLQALNPFHVITYRTIDCLAINS